MAGAGGVVAKAADDARGKPRAAVCAALQPAEVAAAARERRAALADLWTDEGPGGREMKKTRQLARVWKP